MGRKKQNPKYNVLSCRVNDDLRQCISHALGQRSIQDFLHTAVEEKLVNDRQARIDKLIREHRR